MAWFGLTERAHEYLSLARRIARRLRWFQDFSGELEVSAQIIPVLMLSPDFLRVFMPLALRAAARRGRRPVHDRDEALGTVLRAFAEMAGTDDAAASKARCDEPIGADFVRRIEAIFIENARQQAALRLCTSRDDEFGRRIRLRIVEPDFSDGRYRPPHDRGINLATLEGYGQSIWIIVVAAKFVSMSKFLRDPLP